MLWPRQLTLLAFLHAIAGVAVAQAGDRADEAFWNRVYQENHVLDVQIAMTREAWEAMQPRSRSASGFDNEYPYAKATLTVDGVELADAGLRFKGNSSYKFSSKSLKRPLKIDTDRFVEGQKLHGRTRLNLSNAFLDSAFMKEKLAYELYRAAGLATPGVGWANVTLTVEGVLNREPLGIYVIIEQVDGGFVERQFGNATKGSLLMKPEGREVHDWKYLGDDPAAYDQYNIQTGRKNEELIRKFAGVLKLIESASDAEFGREIPERMDLEQFAGYLAVTSLLVNIDSYIGMYHNYYLLLDKADGRLRLLPWDVNEAFGTFNFDVNDATGRFQPQPVEELVEWDVNKPWRTSRRLVERLFETEYFPRLYRTALARLMAEDFTEEKLFQRIAVFEQAIAPYFENDRQGAGLDGLRLGINGDAEGINTAVDRRVFAIKPFITRRIESVKAQLAGDTDGEPIPRRPRR